MAGLFGRGGGGNSSNNNNSSSSNNNSSSNSNNYGNSNNYNNSSSRNAGNDNSYNQTSYGGSGGHGQSNTQSSYGTGGNSYSSQDQSSGGGGYNSSISNTGGGGYGGNISSSNNSNNNTSGGGSGMTRSGSNAGTVSSVGTGSQFGSINDDQMERASISTFGGGTSVASGSDYQKPAGNSGGGVSLGGVANELMSRDDTQSGGGGRGYGQQQQQASGGGGGQSLQSNNSYSGNQVSSQGQYGSDEYGASTPQASAPMGGGSSNFNDNSSGTYNDRGANDSYNNNNGNNNQSGGQSQNAVPQSMGTSNASAFETTDQSNFVDSGPVAIAADFNSETAEIIFLSSEAGQGANRQPATRFRIHEVNLNVHSNVLSEMADTDEDENDNTNGNVDREPIHLEEDAATMKLLFGLMYNRPAPPLTMSDWQVVLRMARAAQKYDCARAKEVAAAYFTEQEQLGALSPFMTYAFAVQYKLQALEEAAAERSVRYDIHRLPELVFGMMGFAAYQKLSSFHARRQTHYQDVLNNISMDPKELADQCYQTGGICVVGPWQKLKTKLAWPRQTGRDGSRRPPEPTDVLRKVVTEIGQIDCGTCAKALCEGAMQAQMALTSMPSYNEEEEDSF